MAQISTYGAAASVDRRTASSGRTGKRDRCSLVTAVGTWLQVAVHLSLWDSQVAAVNVS